MSLDTSNKTSSIILSNVAYQCYAGLFYGGVWGMVTPFHPVGSPGAFAEKKGIFKPAPPFSSISSIGSNAAICASLMGIHKLSSQGIGFARQREDLFNDIFGFFVSYRYYSFFLGSTEKRLIFHNRAIGAGTVLTLFYSFLLV